MKWRPYRHSINSGKHSANNPKFRNCLPSVVINFYNVLSMPVTGLGLNSYPFKMFVCEVTEAKC